MNNRWLVGGILTALLVLFTACDDEVSYSDMKEKERDAVNAFIKDEGINIISYKKFEENGFVTDVDNNEYVLINDCYMQIVRNPAPEKVSDAYKMKDGESLLLLVRYFEYNIMEGEIISGNDSENYTDTDNPDVMRVTLTSDTYSATFIDGYMKAMYGNSVPAGWLVPLPYLYLTRSHSQSAKVNIIVPHTKGTSTASSYVYPCFYSITFIPDRLYDTN